MAECECNTTRSHVESTRTCSSGEDEKFLSLPQEIRLTVAFALRCKRFCQAAMRSYKNESLVTEDEWQLLTHLPNVLKLPVPSRPHVAPLHSQLCHQVKKDHYAMSVFLEFLRHSKRQQFASDKNLLSGEFDDVEYALDCLLIRLVSISKQQGMSIDHKVDSSVIPEYLRNFRSQKFRHFRDFLILQDAAIFVKNLITYYDDMFHLVSQL